MSDTQKPKKKSPGGYVLARPPRSAGKDRSKRTKKEEGELDAFAKGFLQALVDAPPPTPGYIAWWVSKRASASTSYLRELETLMASIRLKANSESREAKAARNILPEAERHLHRAKEADRSASEACEEAHRNQHHKDTDWARSRNSHLGGMARKDAEQAKEALETVRRLATRMKLQ